MKVEALTLNSFEPHVGSTFQLSADDVKLDLVLREATALPVHAGSPREPFSLLFAGPGEPAAEQGTWPLDHPEMGSIALFLVPVGPGGGGLLYEAIFA